MNTRLHMLLACASCAALCAMSAVCATEQWSVPGGDTIMQIVADGSGGCAFAYRDASNNVTLVWLDKKGQTIFESHPTNHYMWPVIVCTKKTLLFADLRPGPVIVQAANDGTETVLAEPGAVITSSAYGMYRQAVTADAKGFFAVNVTPISPGGQTLVRFKNR
ncbi:hypothetical protein GX586_09585 [bacterium]|nr:hypothetical protein [bacterium]